MCAQGRQTSNYVEITERVLHHYPKQTLLDAEKGYKYNFEASPENDQAWKEFRQQGFMTLEELKKLSLWKTGGRQQANIASNSAEAVKAITRAAIQVNLELPEEPSLPVGILTTLQGVDIPIASTIMAVWDPQRFGILDIRVWQALCKAAPDDFRPIVTTGGNRVPFRPNDVALYLCVIREIAAQTALSCREIDKALWVLGEAT